MPCIEDWVSSPLSVIDGICKESTDSAAKSVREFFARRVQDGGHRIPSINDTPLHYLKPNSLVKFRCMVQDMFGPEYYLSVYETVSKDSGEKSLTSGMYRDMADCPEGFQVNFDSPSNVTQEKQTFYCVPIPGETEWAKKAFARKSPQQDMAPPQLSTNTKRTLEQDDQCMDDDGNRASGSCEVSMDTTQTVQEATNKKPRPDNPTPSTQAPGKTGLAPGLNFPLPGEKGPACLVHVYEKCEDVKLNDMVEFIGILSVDPNLALFPEEKESNSDPIVLNPDDFMCEEEQAAHHPPSSLVPRLHCIVLQPLKHSNPAIPAELNEESIESLVPQVVQVRDDLLSLLTKLLCGDSLAAEFLLLHLVSSVYTRSGVMAVGKFALNLSGCPTQESSTTYLFTVQVAAILEQVMSKCFHLVMTLSNLNTLSFVPKKDYNANRLISGILQLSNGTEVIINEVAMKAGQLNATGIQNITALGNLISWQKLEYDFNFYKSEFQTNVQVLILSEGKSLLPCDCHVKLHPEMASQPADIMVSGLSIDMLEKIRGYLALLQFAKYSVSPEMQKTLQEDFVNSRQEGRTKMTADDFHLHLLLARLMALSFGCDSLTAEIWNKVKQIEVTRRARLPLTPPSQ